MTPPLNVESLVEADARIRERCGERVNRARTIPVTHGRNVLKRALQVANGRIGQILNVARGERGVYAVEGAHDLDFGLVPVNTTLNAHGGAVAPGALEDLAGGVRVRRQRTLERYLFGLGSLGTVGVHQLQLALVHALILNKQLLVKVRTRIAELVHAGLDHARLLGLAQGLHLGVRVREEAHLGYFAAARARLAAQRAQALLHARAVLNAVVGSVYVYG